MDINHQLSIRKLTLSSKLENVCEIESFLQQCSNCSAIDSQLYNDILLVLTEAVTNGICHGNCLNPRKKVVIEFYSDQRGMSFSITDEGKGFNPKAIPDPTHPANVAQPNGRGVYLMRALSDQVRFSDNGRCVNIRFSY